jgi:molybdate transport repressor ModE-like protein
MVGTRSRRDRQIATLQPRIKIWLEAEGRYAFGFGLCEILQAVEHTGSIKQAAGELGKSYRYIWGRVKQAEDALGKQLVETQVGGRDVQRSRLTPDAGRLLADFLALREDLKSLLNSAYRRRFG